MLYVSLVSLVFLLFVHFPLSLVSFLLSFLFFTFTSAPSTGHPNAIEHLLLRLTRLPLLPSRSRGPRTVSRPSISLRWSMWGCTFHLHHWLYLLLIYAASLVLLPLLPPRALPLPPRAVKDLLAGWCAGGLCQGVKYDDWHRVVWRRRSVQHHLRHG